MCFMWEELSLLYLFRPPTQTKRAHTNPAPRDYTAFPHGHPPKGHLHLTL